MPGAGAQPQAAVGESSSSLSPSVAADVDARHGNESFSHLVVVSEQSILLQVGPYCAGAIYHFTEASTMAQEAQSHLRLIQVTERVEQWLCLVNGLASVTFTECDVSESSSQVLKTLALDPGSTLLRIP